MIIAKPDETEKMYQKNLAALPAWLKDIVSKIPEEELREKVEVTYNAEGYPVCRYRRDGICFHITSEHPVREAAMWGKSIQPEDSAEIFLYGSGFGYTLFELFDKKPVHTFVVVFEQDIYLFKAMLYYFDLLPLFETQKIIFFIGDSSIFKKAFSQLFCTMLFFITTYPTVLCALPAVRNFKNEYLEIHRYIFKELSLLASCIGNSHQDDMTGLRNLLANIKEVLKSPYLSCMKGKYSGVPAIIVSNGPSLDGALPLLKQIQGRGLMISVESAIVPLMKNGIKPDILTALERTKVNYQLHFEDQHYSPDIALFALAMVDPRTFPSFAGEKIPIFRQGEELNRWFNRNLGDGSELAAGSSVAHLAVAVAMYLGADPIVFVGQDFAYGPGGVTHSKDAAVLQEKGKPVRDIIHSCPTVYVEGNNGEMIPSNQLWTNFRMGMENIISDHPEHHFYNATEGGAKIQGTDRAELGGLIQQYFIKPIPYRVNDLIAENREKVSITERGVLLEKIYADVQHYTELFRDLAHETNLKKLECETMMLLCAGEDEWKYQDILDETYQKNLDSFYGYAKDSLCRFFFQRLICAYSYLINGLGAINTQVKRTQMFDLHRQYYRDLRVVCQSVRVTLEESAQAVSEELQKKDDVVVRAEQKQLSLCIITKNEESFFPACLEDMNEIADEMLVIDLGSGDRTPELAKRAGAMVYRLEWEDDFSKIKNFCMDHATGKWVLFLQADEVISHERLKELKLLLQNPSAEGYLMGVDDSQGEKAVSSPTQFLRLIRNRKNYRFQYRSYTAIPEEELCSLQSSSLRIAFREGKTTGWQKEERSRLLKKDLLEHPQEGYLRYLKGIELMNQGKCKESAASLELARKAFVGGYLYVPHLYKCLGICFLSLGRDKEAEEVLSVGFWLFPYYTDLLVLRAELYHRLHRSDEAMKELETCLALQKSPNVCVPKPEIDLSVTGEMLEDFQNSLKDSYDE